ncbi:hypothetical protein AGLY_016795 [Aphis glycines]|uniref:FLYWCH-type domain-containing protein n=1 Tax=Aphis glycines TaxID=307491 RepID=A0A6G0SWT5_APHGL|nr:hypothetical protein AGLY_016795 [Aphis glycines]
MESVNEVRTITSQRKTTLLVVNDFKYRLIKKTKDSLMSWRCTRKTCKASLLTELNYTILSTKGNHEHPKENKIELQVFREHCKQKALESLSTKPSNLLRTELLKFPVATNDKNMRSLRKAIYNQRRKLFPKFSKSIDQVFLQLKEMKYNSCYMYKNKDFVYIPNTDDFICLTTQENLNFMVNNCDEYFTDGTIDYAPKFFLQMYTIYSMKNGFYLPLVYFFLKNKTKNTYEAIWKFLNKLCVELCSFPLTVQKLHLDFDKNVHGAAINVFPGVALIGCHFHYHQCLWHKINEHSQLRYPYMKNDDDFGKWIKMFYGLTFLPPNEIEDAFIELISICPNHKNGIIFSDYILETFVSPNCIFPPNVWASEPSLNSSLRTINGPESFHRTFDGQFYARHPQVPKVISILIQTQAETSTKLYSIAQEGSANKMTKEDTLLYDKIISLYNNYKNNKTPDTLINYLIELSQLYKQGRI